jgi:mono/diheme cytochrome c family protein
MKIFLAIYVLAIVAVVSILGFRGSKTENEPLEVFPDMDRQARYKPQGENSFFEDRRNDRPVPAHTVARGNYLNYDQVFDADYENTVLGDTRYLYGKNIDDSFVETLPVEATYQLIQAGQKKYDIFCSSCHGPAGDGNGVTKPYGVLATSYHDERLRGVEDGYLYDVISNGKGLMYGLKDRMTPEERWAVVLYVRALQKSQHADAGELSAAQRKELGL